MDIKIGQTVLINNDIINHSGEIILEKGQTVTISGIDIKKGFWGKNSGIWYPDKITGIRIKEQYGIWSLNCFEQLSNK